MKKIFTLLCLMAMTVTSAFAAETVVWEGEQAVSWGTGPIISASNFASAAEGDELVLTVTVANPSAGWMQIQLSTDGPEGWAKIEGIENVHVADGMTNYEVRYTINATLLEVLQSTGLVIQGDNFTLTKIAFESPRVFTETKLWEGTATIASWSDNKMFEASLFADVAEGDILRFYVSDVASGAQWKLVDLTPDAGWPNLPGTGAYNDLATSATYFDYVVTAEGLVLLQQYGTAIQGHDYTCTGISIMKETDPSGIQGVQVEQEADPNAPIYNLAGQRVSKDTKGILIQNGKKFVNK